MTRTTAKAAALLALLAAPAAAQLRAPESGGRPLEYEAVARAFTKAGPLEPGVEYLQRWQYDGGRRFQSLQLGGYSRVAKNLKLGAFWRLQGGARHDDDWVRNGPGDWAWRNTTGRSEQVIGVDAVPRVLLPFLPGGDWTGTMRVRYERNLYNNHEVLRLEPELACFWMDGLRPLATAFVRHEQHLALNFGNGLVWERWTYLAALYHAHPHLSLGPTLAWRDEFWSSSNDYASTATAGQSYRVLYKSFMMGLTLSSRW